MEIGQCSAQNMDIINSRFNTNIIDMLYASNERKRESSHWHVLQLLHLDSNYEILKWQSLWFTFAKQQTKKAQYPIQSHSPNCPSSWRCLQIMTAGRSKLQSSRTTRIQGIKTEVAASSPPPPPSTTIAVLKPAIFRVCVLNGQVGGSEPWKDISWLSWNILDNQWYDDERNTPSFTQSFLCCQFSIECSIGRRNYVRVSDLHFHNIDEYILTLPSVHRVLQARLFPEQYFRAIAAFSAPFQSNPEKFMRNAAIALKCYK